VSQKNGLGSFRSVYGCNIKTSFVLCLVHAKLPKHLLHHRCCMQMAHMHMLQATPSNCMTMTASKPNHQMVYSWPGEFTLSADQTLHSLDDMERLLIPAASGARLLCCPHLRFILARVCPEHKHNSVADMQNTPGCRNNHVR